jgi:hypothetical protein
MELAIESSGASVISASSFDVDYPPRAIMEDTQTFWMSTGSYPQELIVQLGEPSLVKSIDIVCTGLRKLELAKCDGNQANSWKTISKQEASDTEGDVQRLSLDVPQRLTATYLRLRILSGYADYVTIHRMSVLGQSGGTKK